MKRRDFLKTIGAVPAAAVIVYGHANISAKTSDLAGPAALDATKLAPMGDELQIGLLSNGKEVDLGGYTRVIIPRSARSWTVDGDGVSNAEVITFPEITGGGGLLVDSFVIADQNGTPLLSGNLAADVMLGAGCSFRFNPGALSISLWED